MSTKNHGSWLSGLVILALVAMPRLSDAAEHEYAVSGAVYRGNEPDLGLSDLWLAALSKQPALKVLDRANIRAILGEFSLSGVGEDSARQVRLGSLLGVEYFAWLKISDEQVLLEIIEAATGRGVAVKVMPVTIGEWGGNLAKLAEQAMQEIQKPLPKPIRGAPAIAFSIPIFSTTNTSTQAAVEQIIAGLSESVLNSGITILPRRFAADTIQERWRQEKGLAVDVAGEGQFLGADYIFGITVEATNRIEFIMVETATGRRIGKMEMPLQETRMEVGLKAVKQWGLERLKPILETSAILPAIAATNTTHYSSPEILKSLYAGMVLHNQGRYLDAIPCFDEPQIFHGDEVNAWLSSCYRLAGFPEIAEMFISKATDANRTTGLSFSAQSTPGIILLGVTAQPGLPRGMAERMGMLLIDRLHHVTGAPVLASEDIAGLRDEYDLLLGLDKVKGTTWRQAPPILVQNSVTAHLEFDDVEFRLRLCLIRNCSPTTIIDVVTRLPDDHVQWPALVDKAATELLSRSEQGSVKWIPPKLEILEDQQRLLAQLNKRYTPVTYLKALTKNPALTKYRTETPYRLELERWFLRILPEGHSERPLLEFSVASLPLESVGYRHPNDLRNKCAEFQEIANKYPQDLVGLFSRYNVALIGMTATNFVATQAVISGLIPELMRFENDQTSRTLASINAMDSALRYVLGMPGGEPVDVFSHGDVVTVNNRNKWGVIFSPGNVNCEVLHYDDSRLKTVDQMRVDLEAACFLRNQMVIPTRFLMGIIEKNGPASELTQYAVVKYLKNTVNGYYYVADYDWKKECSEEDLCIIYPVFANSFRKYLSQEPKPISKFMAETIIRQEHRLPQNPKIINAVRDAHQTIQTAFSPPSDGQARKLYEESWRVGPLKDHAWAANKNQIVAPRAIIDHYYPYLGRLHELYDNKVKSHAICQLYCQFGSAFFEAGRYDLAEPLFEQIITWRDYKNRPPEEHSYVQALYLLAILKQKNGGTPAALRLAKELVEFANQYPGITFPLSSHTGCNFGSDLKSRATVLIKELRENPGMNFENPYNKQL